ncbi:MAG: class I SAM-dependent methyltransferase [Acidimicrobiales bacterium]
MTTTAAAAWSEALGQWAIPEHILASAPEPPWHFSPELFTDIALAALAQTEPTPARRVATEALADGGTVLDVGAGAGTACLPLAPPATLLIALDPSAGMLESFADLATKRGVPHQVIEGNWPDASDVTPMADVVVSHNVIYNIADLPAFFAALSEHARRRVVVEMTADHPTSSMNPLWKAIWDIDRPTGPTATDALAVLGEMGIAASHERSQREWSYLRDNRQQAVAQARRRLCVGPDRDAEIDALLVPAISTPTREAVAIWWDTAPAGA